MEINASPFGTEPTQNSKKWPQDKCAKCGVDTTDTPLKKAGFFGCGGGSKSNKIHPKMGHPALGAVYCTDCFVCANGDCRVPLTTSKVLFEMDDALYCKKCKGPTVHLMSEQKAKMVRSQVERKMLRASRNSLIGTGSKAAAAVFQGSFRWRQKKSLHWIGQDTADANRRLLSNGKPTEVALVFIEGREDKTSGPLLEQQVRDATTWALDALCHAYEDGRIKTAARQLLATATFSCNLDAVHYSDDPPLRCFSDFLKPGLETRLVKLGQHLALDYITKDLRTAFDPERVTAAVGDPRSHPLAIKAGSDRTPTQLDVLPCDPSGEFIDFSKPWTFPDSIFAHALLMVAHATDRFFQQRLAVVLALHNRKYRKGRGTAKLHPAPRKAFPRVFTKMRSDYRHQPPPRAQYNVDVIRSLATAKSAPELISLASFCTAVFGGATKVKNLAAASSAERAERFHLLPMMLTVNVDVGLTYGEFVKLPQVQTSVEEYIAARSAGVPKHRWATTTSAAWSMLQSSDLADVPVQILGEVQMTLAGHAVVRNQMHEVYKAWRAETEMLLHRDFFDAAGRDTIPEDAVPHSIQQAAVFECLPDVIRLIAEKAGGIDDPDKYGQTGLFVSAEMGHTDIVKVMIEGGANVDKARNDGATPLHIAAQNGEGGSVQLLIEAGAALDTPQNESGTTPLWIASESGHADVVKQLLEGGAGQNKGKGRKKNPAGHKPQQYHRIFTPSREGITPVDVAVQNHHHSVVKLLAEAGANIDVPRSDSGSTQVGFAAYVGDVEMIKVLVAAGANLNTPRTGTGTTPLLAAVEQGHAAAVKELLAARANPNKHGEGFLGPLGAAVQRCRPALVALLVDADADVNAPRLDGTSQLILSSHVGDELSMKHLIDGGAHVDYARPQDGTTALISAMNAKEIDAVKILLDANADPNKPWPNGATPLHIATQMGSSAIVSLLLDAGGTGPRALEALARQLEFAEIAALLEAHFSNPITQPLPAE
eukprot:m.175489 g.175489  ORF g.175489 m.175489 type:complete len:993 (+) comp24410_c0_seq1:258-3236(+)